MLIPDDDAMDHILPCVFHIDSSAFEWKPPDASCLLMARTDAPLIHNPEKEKSWKAEDGEKEGRSKKEAARGHGRKERISFSHTTFQGNQATYGEAYFMPANSLDPPRTRMMTQFFFFVRRSGTKTYFFCAPALAPCESIEYHRISSNTAEQEPQRMLTCTPAVEHQ